MLGREPGISLLDPHDKRVRAVVGVWWLFGRYLVDHATSTPLAVHLSRHF
jgi:hypothetical protein